MLLIVNYCYDLVRGLVDPLHSGYEDWGASLGSQNLPHPFYCNQIIGLLEIRLPHRGALVVGGDAVDRVPELVDGMGQISPSSWSLSILFLSKVLSFS